MTAEEGDSIEVTFAPDGHRSVFSRAWLAAAALTLVLTAMLAVMVTVLSDGHVDADFDVDAQAEDGKVLWRAASPGSVPAPADPAFTNPHLRLHHHEGFSPGEGYESYT